MTIESFKLKSCWSKVILQSWWLFWHGGSWLLLCESCHTSAPAGLRLVWYVVYQWKRLWMRQWEGDRLISQETILIISNISHLPNILLPRKLLICFVLFFYTCVWNCCFQISFKAVCMFVFIHCFSEKFQAQKNPRLNVVKLICQKLLLFFAHQIYSDYSAVLQSTELNSNTEWSLLLPHEEEEENSTSFLFLVFYWQCNRVIQ